MLIIKSFAHKGLENYFYSGAKKGIQTQHAQKLGDILGRLDAAKDVTDMKFPESGLHQLKGKMKGLWMVKISGNWRIAFNFKEANACDVNYIDYH